MLEHKPKLIGITGGTCSGKTTLVNEVTRNLGNQAISFSFDEYFLGMNTVKQWDVKDWEDPNLYNLFKLHGDLEKLSNKQPVTIICNSRESLKTGINTRLIEPKPLIFVEGFLLFHDPFIRNYFADKIYVDIPEDILITRRLARIKTDEGWDDKNYINDKLLPGHRRFVVPQKKYADLVLDGTQSLESLSKQLQNFLIG